MSSRYRFQASAIGAAGSITVPFQEQIEVQASCALPEIGGYGSAISAPFKHRHILSFSSAHSEVIGSKLLEGKDSVYYTLARSTVEELNVMGMVTADRIVAQIVKMYKVIGGDSSNVEQSFNLVGTRFENLKIAGKPIEVDLAVDVFDKCATYEQLPQEYRGDNKGGGALTSLSLVRKGDGNVSGYDGRTIHLDGFGTIHLAELEIGAFTRRVNMLEIEFGCPVQGRIMACSIIGNGSTF